MLEALLLHSAQRPSATTGLPTKTPRKAEEESEEHEEEHEEEEQQEEESRSWDEEKDEQEDGCRPKEVAVSRPNLPSLPKVKPL